MVFNSLRIGKNFVTIHRFRKMSFYTPAHRRCRAGRRPDFVRKTMPVHRRCTQLGPETRPCQVPRRGTFVQLCVVVNVHYLSAMGNNNSDKPKCETSFYSNQRDFQSMRNRVVLHIQETPTLEFCSMLSWSRTRLRK